jgi:hypothetical protein
MWFQHAAPLSTFHTKCVIGLKPFPGHVDLLVRSDHLASAFTYVFFFFFFSSSFSFFFFFEHLAHEEFSQPQSGAHFP